MNKKLSLYKQILEAEKKRWDRDKEKEEFLKTFKGPVKFNRIPLECTNDNCRCKSRKKENEGLKRE